MFNPRRKHSRKHHRRIDAAPAVRFSRVRRLAVETMETRLLLSGNQLTGGDLDDSIWNLDSVGGNGYVVISQGDSTTSPSTADSDTMAPSLGDVGGSYVPEVPYNAGQAQPPANPPISYVSDFQLNVVTPLTGNLGSTNSLIGAYTPPNLSTLTPAALADDVIGTGDFNRDGIVDAADYRVWRDSSGTLNVLAYNNWRTNFGKSVVELLEIEPLGRNRTVEFGGASERLQAITVDVIPSFELVVSTGTLKTAVELELRIQDAFSVGTPSIVRLDPVNSSIVWLDPVAEIEYDRLFNGTSAGPVAIAKIEDADIATAGSVLIVDLDGGSNQLIVSTAPARIETSSPQQSKADQELDQAIDELLEGDTIFVSESDGAGSETVAHTGTPESSGAIDLAAGDFFSEGSTDAQSQVGESAEAAPANQLVEGGMIAIGEIVDAATSDAIAPSISQLADAGQATELVGELSRVAVMELIEGEAEPGEPQSADHVMVVAAGDSHSLDAYRVVVQQAGVAIALASPAGPTYLASIATAAVEAASRAMATLVGNHLAADAVDELASADAARQEAFSELGSADDEVETTAATGGPHWNHWLAATPLVLAIACERALAARNKRRDQRDPAQRRSSVS
jgi:hypothetical protein